MAPSKSAKNRARSSPFVSRLEGRKDIAPELSVESAETGRQDSEEDRRDLAAEIADLRIVQADLEASRNRYMDLYTFAPIGYLTLTAGSKISEINLTGIGMFMGQAHDEVLDQLFDRFVSPKDRSRYGLMMAQVKSDGERHSCALGLQRSDGSSFPAQLDCVRERSGDSSSVRVTVTDLTERRRLELEIERLAFYDSLTRLPNRRLLLDRLHQAAVGCARTKLHGALLIIDLDDFKTLNDTQGHDAGDLLLQQAGQRLTACVRAFDTVARLGGDEFVVMLEGLSKEPGRAAGEAKAVGEKILTALNERYFLGAEEYRSSGSVGATLFGSEQESVNDLLKRADLALYRSKAAGGGMLWFFEPEMQAAVTARAAFEVDLRRGLQDGHFVLYYQPQVDHDGRAIGAEALLRWRHPERGLLSPQAFIPLAEEKGFIVSLGLWVLYAACRQLLTWGTNPDTSHLTLSINISAHEFRQPNFAIRMLETIDQIGANPERLILEFTESSILGNLEDTVAKIDFLRARGLRFSLDDFGIGYSSLTYLKNFPLDQLKIDRSFVANVTTSSKDAAIAGSIISLGNNLGVAVIAEGVETAEQRDFLLAQGCKEFQGYFFGRPNPVEDWL